MPEDVLGCADCVTGCADDLRQSEIIGAADQLLHARLAVWSPCVLAVSFLTLLHVTMLVAVATDHADGQIIPGVSRASRHAPEYWIWLCGVLLTLLGAFKPMSILTYRALLPERGGPETGGPETGGCLPCGIFSAYVCASMCLIGLAAIPMQDDTYDVYCVYDPADNITTHEDSTMQSWVHWACANVFFWLMINTPIVIVVWQWGCCSRCGRRIGLVSLVLKTVLVVALPFSDMIGPLLAHVYLSVFYGREFADTEFTANAPGASQRILIALIAVFAATFVFEIKALQHEVAWPDARTTILGPPVATISAEQSAVGTEAQPSSTQAEVPVTTTSAGQSEIGPEAHPSSNHGEVPAVMISAGQSAVGPETQPSSTQGKVPVTTTSAGLPEISPETQPSSIERFETCLDTSPLSNL